MMPPPVGDGFDPLGPISHRGGSAVDNLRRHFHVNCRAGYLKSAFRVPEARASFILADS